MDFLDPKKMRSRQTRLIIGHSLMVLLVVVATYLLVYRAYGFGVDTQTGQVTQNSLVYIDSAPNGSEIRINGEYRNNTNRRLALNEGQYDLEISKEGYRSWTNSLDIQGGQVVRISYPTLFPSSLNPIEFISLDKPIDLATESPDRRWMVLSEKNDLKKFIIYDLNTRTDNLPIASEIDFQDGLMTNAPGAHTISEVEWSSDNRHLLVEHMWSAGSEFVMIDREKPAESYNLNSLLKKKPSSVAMLDKKFDQLYVYTKNNKRLDKYDVSQDVLTNYATGVISYKPHGKDRMLLSRTTIDKMFAEFVLIEGDQEYVMRTIPIQNNFPLEIAQFDNDWFVGISSSKEQKTYIYKNPQAQFGSSPNIEDASTIVLSSDAAIDDLSFSSSARFIMARAGSQFTVYDAENEEQFNYKIDETLSSNEDPKWMDGHRIIAYTKNDIVVFDFDGTNKQNLIKADTSLPVLFERDYTELISFSLPDPETKTQAINITQLRLEGDK